MCKLLIKTRELLRESDIPLQDIATAVHVSYPWLTRLKGKAYENECPSVDKVERLYEFLSGKELEV